MQRILSTYRFVNQPLNPAMLQAIARAGISGIEIFCAPTHFGYGDPQSVRELAGALTDYRLQLHSLHAPTERNSSATRESGSPISISEPERIRRQDAVDEVKRALDVAEIIPFRYLVQHMGSSRQAADPRNFDAAFGSLERLAVFAKERGVTIALENTTSEIGAPASLQKFAKETHLRGLRFCFDLGHAHLDGGVDANFALLHDLVVTAHVHDNHGEKDEHLLPYEGSIDWDAAIAALATAPELPALVLELKEQPAGAPPLDRIRAAFDKLEKHLDKKGVRSVRT
jgi:sugar phosphate isomerase/epimerase